MKMAIIIWGSRRENVIETKRIRCLINLFEDLAVHCRCTVYAYFASQRAPPLVRDDHVVEGGLELVQRLQPGQEARGGRQPAQRHHPQHGAAALGQVAGEGQRGRRRGRGAVQGHGSEDVKKKTWGSCVTKKQVK